MGLFDAIHQALAREAVINSNLSKSAFDILESYSVSPASDSLGPIASASSAKPILQLNAIPVTIEPEKYRNPLSSSNPGGSVAALWSFRQLVDPVPSFTRYYNSSASSTESTYSLIVNGASVAGANPFAGGVLSQSQKLLSQFRYSNMDGTTGTWAPIYATPDDWCETSSGRYLPLGFNLQSAGSADSPFDVVPGPEPPLALQIHDGGSAPKVRPIAEASLVHEVNLKYLQVSLSRPWLTEMLFGTGGWLLSNQPAGFCSSGSLSANSGVLALLATSIIFATDVTIDAQWSAVDQAAIGAACDKGRQVSLGPFVLNPNSGESPLQVLGWITQLVPYSPKLA